MIKKNYDMANIQYLRKILQIEIGSFNLWVKMPTSDILELQFWFFYVLPSIW